MAKKRTEMRSKAGKLLYAVRDEQGEFADIQTYQRAHADDMRFHSQAELEKKAKKKAKKKVEKKTAVGKSAKKKAAEKHAKKKSSKRRK